MPDNPFEAPAAETPRAEVRRCARCRRPAMVRVLEYESRLMFGLVRGGPSGVGDFVCQECGYGVTLHPVQWIAMLFVVPGVMLLGMGLWAYVAAFVEGELLLGLGLGSLALAVGAILVAIPGWPVWLRARHPVVPDVPAPAIRYTDVHPRRRCTCGGDARCVSVEVNSMNRVYTGTELGYRCVRCGSAFTVESPLSTVTGAFGLVFLAACGGGLGWKAETWGEIAFSALVVVGGLVFGVVSGRRLLVRFRRPIVRDQRPDGAG